MSLKTHAGVYGKEKQAGGWYHVNTLAEYDAIMVSCCDGIMLLLLLVVGVAVAFSC